MQQVYEPVLPPCCSCRCAGVNTYIGNTRAEVGQPPNDIRDDNRDMPTPTRCVDDPSAQHRHLERVLPPSEAGEGDGD